MALNRRHSLPLVLNIAPPDTLHEFSPRALVLDTSPFPVIYEEGMPSVYGSWSRGGQTASGSFLSDAQIGTSVKLTSGTKEDQITAPSGREIVINSRRALAGRVGRGGAGNAISTSDESQQAAEKILNQERQVLHHYKQNSVPDYKTGRGGAGAKGHVNVRGKIPNQERALAKERYVQMKWKAEKEAKGSVRTGRGGSGNIIKGTTEGSMKGGSVASTSNSPFATSALDRRRRNRVSLNNAASIFSTGPGSIRPSYEGSRPGTSQAYDWDYAETINDLESGITTTVANPSTVFRASPASTRFPPITPLSRLPTEVAPFHEPFTPAPTEVPQATVRPREKQSNTLTSDAATKRPKSLFKSFKNLHLGRGKEEKQYSHSDVLDIAFPLSRQSSAPSSVDINGSTIQHAHRLLVTPASAALGMVDPSVRFHAFPRRDIGPTIISLHAGMDDSRSSSERSDTGGYVRERVESSTSASSGRSLVLPSPPTHTPVTPTHTPITLPPIPVLVKAPEVIRRKRPLPIPPVSAHPIFQAPTPRSLPSPPDTPLGIIYLGENKPTGLPIYAERMDVPLTG